MFDIATSLMGMDRVGVRELRQNPGPVLRAVEAGAEVTVSVSGRPVARIVPIETPTWVDGERAAHIYSAKVDPGWQTELTRAREAEDLVDPWT